MRSGKIFQWEKLELNLEVTPKIERSNDLPGLEFNACLLTRYTENSESLNEGISLQVKGVIAGKESFQSNQQSVILKIPYTGYYKEIDLDEVQACLRTTIVLYDVKLYCTDKGTWNLIIKKLEFYIQDVLYDTLEKLSLSSDILTPSSIPLLGIPVELSSHCDLDPKLVLGFGRENTEPFRAEGHCQVRGGWRFFENNTWYTLPISVDSNENLGGTNTYNAFVHSKTSVKYDEKPLPDLNIDYGADGQQAIQPAIIRCTQILKSCQSSRTSLILLPDLNKSVRQMNPDYAALIYHSDFPKVSKIIETLDSFHPWSKTLNIFDNSSKPIIEHIETHSAASETISLVTSESSNLEKLFNLKSFSPYSIQNSTWEIQDVDFIEKEDGIFKPADGNFHGQQPDYSMSEHRWLKQQSNSILFPFISAQKDILSILNHSKHLPLYINTIVHPHWNCFYYFPKNQDLDHWKVRREKLKSEDYWIPLKTQFLEQTEYNIHRKTRTSLISAPLKNPISKIYQKHLGVSTCWWGISRFRIDNAKPCSIKTLDKNSISHWKINQGNLSFKDQIEIKSTIKNAVLEFDLKGFEIIGHKIELGWESQNIESCKVYLESSQGDKRLLADKPGIYERLRGSDRFYAGSWAQDFGLEIISDKGKDLENNGCSLQVNTDVYNAFNFGLLASGNAVKLKFEFIIQDIDKKISIHYPKFYSLKKHVTVVQEGFGRSSLLWPDSNGLRFGLWKWSDGKEVFNTPQLAKVGKYHPTILDWFYWKKIILHTDIPVEQQAKFLFDNNEFEYLYELGHSSSVFLISGGIAGRGILVDHIAEVPPLACFPIRGRDKNLKCTQEWSQESWSYAQEPRYYIMPGDKPLQLAYKDCILTQPSSYKISGWSITKFIKPVIEEHCNLVIDNLKLANVSSWHSYFGIASILKHKKAFPWNLCTEIGHYHRVQCENGEIIYRRSNSLKPIGKWSSLATLTCLGDCLGARMIEKPNGRLIMNFSRAKNSGIYEFFSDDDGLTWSDIKLAFEKGKYPTLHCGIDGTLIRSAFVHISNDSGPGYLIGSIQYPGETKPSKPFQFKNAEGLDLLVSEDSFHLVQSQDEAGSWILTVNIEGDKETSDWQSWDECKSWSRIDHE